MLYEQLVSEGLINPKDVSRPTVYRFIEDLSLTGELKRTDEGPETLGFAYEHVGIYGREM